MEPENQPRTPTSRADLHAATPKTDTITLSRSACIEENTTWDLVRYELCIVFRIESDVLPPTSRDTEKVREHLGIEKWHVFGGSWVGAL